MTTSVNLQTWSAHVKQALVGEATSPPSVDLTWDHGLKRLVLELSQEQAESFITSPPPHMSNHHIEQPIFGLEIKQVEKRFCVEILVRTLNNKVHRLYLVNLSTQLEDFPSETVKHVDLDLGWNTLRVDLNEWCQDAFEEAYLETLRVSIYGDCLLNRVFFQPPAGEVQQKEAVAERFRLFYPEPLTTTAF